MQTRRSLVVSLAGAMVFAGSASAEAPPVDGASGGDKTLTKDGLPVVKVLPGKPVILDYGDGLLVPCSKNAFLTLWEGNTFWLTFGFGISAQKARAQAEAVHHAEGAMKYLLLTLAFAPERLQKVEGHGWRQQVEEPGSYVIGDLEVPGKSSMPLTDASRGFGSSDQGNLGGVVGAGGIGGPGDMPGSGNFGGLSGFNSALMLNKVNAFCSDIVLKKDLSLEDVRARAKRVVL